jgi:hypothetical protein
MARKHGASIATRDPGEKRPSKRPGGENPKIDTAAQSGRDKTSGKVGVSRERTHGRGRVEAMQGITNRPAEDEEHEQEELPPRGYRKNQ